MSFWNRFVRFSLPSIAPYKPAEAEGEQDPEPCGQCPHRMAWHVLVATGPTPMDGGVAVCPACPCALTWAPVGSMRPERPSAHILAYLRLMLFGIQ